MAPPILIIKVIAFHIKSVTCELLYVTIFGTDGYKNRNILELTNLIDSHT